MEGLPKTWRDLYLPETLTVEEIKSLMPSIWDVLLQQRIEELMKEK